MITCHLFGVNVKDQRKPPDLPQNVNTYEGRFLTSEALLWMFGEKIGSKRASVHYSPPDDAK